MHNGDKVFSSGCGQLVRTRGKLPLNSFEPGVEVMDKAHNLSTWFSYGNRLSSLHDCSKVLGTKISLTKFQVRSRKINLLKYKILIYRLINKGRSQYYSDCRAMVPSLLSCATSTSPKDIHQR